MNAEDYISNDDTFDQNSIDTELDRNTNERAEENGASMGTIIVVS